MDTHSWDTATIHTSFGNISFVLFDDTPLHKANFIQLALRKYYDKTQFHRVVKNFVIQGGESDDFSMKKVKRDIGNYTIPAEFLPHHFHKRGAISMARTYDDNPSKRSDAFSFFIVQGETLSLPSLRQEKKGQTLSKEMIHEYTKVGGAPHLDFEHTVFGQVIEGMDVVDKIANCRVNPEDHWPYEAIEMTITLK